MRISILLSIIIIAVSCTRYERNVSAKSEDTLLASEIIHGTRTIEVSLIEETETILLKEARKPNLNYDRKDFLKGTQDGWLYQFRDGKMTVKSQLKNNQLDGKYWSFFDNGKLRSAGTHHKEKKHGLWIQFYISGQQANIGKWTGGVETGDWLFYDAERNLIEERNYDDQSGDYYVLRRDSLGIIRSKGYIKKGNKSGEWRTYSAKGKIIEKSNWLNNKLEGPYEEWFSNGKRAVANYQNGKKEGLVIFYDAKDNNIMNLIFKNDSLITKEVIELE